jgi:Metallo-beta-lactamase superfamily
VPDPVLGDKMLEFRWSDYRDVGNGVKYPFRLHAHKGDHLLIPGHNYLDLRTQDVKINIADAAQAVPDAVRNAPLPTQTNVVSTQLAPGVVLVGGGSHNSVAVEFKDFVTVIEGPLSNQRTNAVVAEVYKLFPNNPIRYLVNTHNHFDHLGGVRGFVVIAYLPKDKIVVNADLYGPPPAGGNMANVGSHAVVLYRNLKRLKLDVATHSADPWQSWLERRFRADRRAGGGAGCRGLTNLASPGEAQSASPKSRGGHCAVLQFLTLGEG